MRQKNKFNRIFCWERLYQLTSNFGFNWWLPLIWIASILVLSSLLSCFFVNDLASVFSVKDYNIKSNVTSIFDKFIFFLNYYARNIFFLGIKTIWVNEIKGVGFCISLLGKFVSFAAAALFLVSFFSIKRSFRV